MNEVHSQLAMKDSTSKVLKIGYGDKNYDA